MSKRTLAILLILVGLIAIAGVLYWAFIIPAKQANPAPVVMPEANPVTEVSPAPAPTLPPPTPTPSPVPRTVTTDEQEQLLLRQQAMVFASRQGSYSNSDGFVALNDVALSVNAAVRAFYQGEIQRLNKDYPLAKGTWTQTARALSSRIASELPLQGKTEAIVVVQAQQVVETSTKAATISYREIRLTFRREAGAWIVSRVESNPLAL